MSNKKNRNFIFTLNNPTMDEIDNLIDSEYKGLKYQHEIGENGTEHLQGFICFGSALSFKSVVDRFGGRAHVEIARFPLKALDYCGKADSRLFGPFRHGDLNVGQGQRMLGVCEKIEGGSKLSEVACSDPDIYVRHSRGLKDFAAIHTKRKARGFRSVSVMVFVGDPGSGKTRKAFEKGGDDVYKLDASNTGVWFDGYDAQSTLIIDDFNGSGIRWTHLLNILDGQELRLDVKGSFTYALWENVIITTNAHPEQWYGQDVMRGCFEGSALDRRIDNIIFFKLKKENKKPIEMSADEFFQEN